MPTKSPRIMFTPTQETHELLQRFSAASGQPVSAIVREMMQNILPHVAMMVDLLERASQLSQGVRDAAGAAAQDALEGLQPLLEEAERAMVKLEHLLDEPGLPLPVSKPPSSNTGATWSGVAQRDAA